MGGPGSGRKKGSMNKRGAKVSALKDTNKRTAQIMSKTGINKTRAKVVANKEKQMIKSRIKKIKAKDARTFGG